MAARVFGAKGRTSRGPHLLTDFRRCADVAPDWLTSSGGANGTRINSHGAMERVTRSNVLANPNDIGAWTQTYVTTTRNTLASPLNNLAGKLVETAVTNEHMAEQVVSAAANVKYDFTAVVYAAERTRVGLRIIDQTATANEARVEFDLTGLTVTSSAQGTGVATAAESSIEDWGDGWYRVRAVLTPSTAANTGLIVRAQLLSAAATWNYLGVAGSGLYIAGTMLEPWAGVVGTHLGATGTNVTQSGRIDFDPASGRRNEIRNSTGRGFQTGAPGTMGTYWDSSAAPFGLARSIVGWGTYTAPDGTEVDCVDVRYSGVANATNNITIAFAPTNQIAAASGQMWAHSVYLQKVDGTIPVNLQMTVHEFDAAAAYLRSNDVVKSSSLITGQLVRVSQTLTAGANTAFLRPLIYFGCVNGQAFDLTLRIGLPQLERDAVTDPIKTYGWARTVYTGLGLLDEEEQTNLFTKSGPVDTNDGWMKGANTTRVGQETFSPYGTLATIYSGNGSGANEFVSQGISVTNGTTYTVRVLARLVSGSKPTGGQLITCETTPGSANPRVALSFNSANLTSTPGEFSVTFTAAGTGNVFLYLAADQNNTAQIALSCAQVSSGGGRSYVPTLATAVTRTADGLLSSGTAFSSWYNQSEGTARIRYRVGATYTTQQRHAGSFNDNTNYNQLRIGWSDGSPATSIGYLVAAGGSSTNTETSGLLAAGQATTVLLTYKAGSYFQAVNGATYNASAFANVPAPTQLNLGARHGPTEHLNGHIEEFGYWRRHMSVNEAAHESVTD